jgi:hypothetical protein
LQREGVRIEEFPQTSANLTAASQNLFELISGRNLVVYPDAAMRLAVSRAVAVETSRGWRISKEKQSHKIDVVVALAMACHAAVSRGESGKVTWNIAAAPWCSAEDRGSGRTFEDYLRNVQQLNPDNDPTVDIEEERWRRAVLGSNYKGPCKNVAS